LAITLPDANDEKCLILFEKVKKELFSYSESINIKNVDQKFFKEIVIPIALYLIGLDKTSKPVLIGLTGGQGSGKTTLSDFVQLTLKKGFNKKTTGFSIDDIYKSPRDRKLLGEKIHPMCGVRGVPGTHDVDLGLKTIESLNNASNETITSIPVFSKPLDKHLPESEWVQFKGKPDFIFFDGWFCGAKPLPEENWLPPVNKLEEKEDPDGVWSKWYNKELSGDYQKLFNSFDILLMIKVPNMEHIFESRWIQEKTLEKNIIDPEMKKKIMTKEEIIHFVMHYERLTRYVLEEIPKFADIVLHRDKKFNFERK
jgi:D-glycerate 3-kinase